MKKLRIGYFLFSFFIFNSASAQTDDTVERIKTPINTTEYDEIAPVISIDGETIYFTRVASPDFVRTIWVDTVDMADQYNAWEYPRVLKQIYTQIGNSSTDDPIRNPLNQDIWYASTRDSLFDLLYHPRYPLNSALPNSVCSLTPEADVLVVMNQFPPEGGLETGFSIQKKVNTEWQLPTPLSIDGYEVRSAADVNMTMANDGSVIVLSMASRQNPQNSDLYVAFRIGENHYGVPQLMGSNVNTPYREVTPHLSPDGKDLYFSSNRSESVGGLDLFVSTRLDDTWLNWTKPNRFVSPINSTSDDTQPFFNHASGYLYFASRREGSSDIFRVKIAPTQPNEVWIKGKILNSFTQQPIDARVLFGGAENDFFEKYSETIDGNFLIKIPQGKTMRFAPLKIGYIAHEIKLNFDKNTFYNKPQEVTLYLDSVAVGANITMNPIYFKRSIAAIMPESYEELDRLAEILRFFPEMHIRIEGHTDNQGTPESLQKLSEDRATAVKQYLVKEKKVKEKRITTAGYGGSKPRNANGTETSRSMNRRVEVVITKLEY